MITIVLVDDHELIRRGLRRELEADGEFQVLGEASNLDEALRVCTLTKPDVVVVDLRLQEGNGLDLVRRLRRDRPEVGIVVLTMYGGDEHLFNALDAGASAFVTKDTPSHHVLAAARHAAANPRTFSAEGLADALRRRADKPDGPQLSPREQDVLTLLVEGLNVAQISKRLYVSESTTKTHISKIYSKLGATNRAQAVMAALRAGLVADPGKRAEGMR